MSDHLANLSARIADPAASLRPRLPSLFEPVTGFPRYLAPRRQRPGGAPSDASDPILPDAAAPLGVPPASGTVLRGPAAGPAPPISAAHGRWSPPMPPPAHDGSRLTEPEANKRRYRRNGNSHAAGAAEIARTGQLGGDLPTIERATGETPGEPTWRPRAPRRTPWRGRGGATRRPGRRGERTAGPAIRAADRKATQWRPSAEAGMPEERHRHKEKRPIQHTARPPPAETPPTRHTTTPPSAETPHPARRPTPSAEASRWSQTDRVAAPGRSRRPSTWLISEDSLTGADHRPDSATARVPSPKRTRPGKSAATEPVPGPPATPPVAAQSTALGRVSPEPPGEPAPVVHVTIGRIEVRAVPSVADRASGTSRAQPRRRR